MGGIPQATHGTAARMIPAEGFSFACYRFTLRLANAARLPGYKGDVFHRALGLGLARVGPRFGQLFYQPQKPPDWPHPGQTPPKPFMLIPPLEERQDYGPGDIMELGLILYGEALQYLMIAFAALEAVGQSRGLDRGRGRFRIEEVAQFQGGEIRTLFRNDQWITQTTPTTAADIFAATPGHADVIDIDTLTRIRLKDKGRLVRQAPVLSVLTERLIGRVNTLSAMCCGGLMLPPEEKAVLATLARTAIISREEIRWSDWNRCGGDGDGIQFGGLVGSVRYQNVPGAILPWLNLGQWTGVGGKTSFGLGVYQLETEQEVIE
jgi:hypothetical protein